MVSYDPFTTPIVVNRPQTLRSQSASALPAPPINTAERQSHIPVKIFDSTIVKETEIQTDGHEFDGAECCDKGNSVNGAEPLTLEIVPLLPISAPSPQPERISRSNPNISTIIEYPADHTCHRCGLNRSSSTHHSVHPTSAPPTATSTHPSSSPPIHTRPNHCLTIFAPDIEAAPTCPDITSPTSPEHDPTSDPFDVYMQHERHHQQQGKSHLRVASLTAIEEQKEKQKRRVANVERGAKQSSMGFGIQKGTGVVEMGVAGTFEL